MSMTQPELIYLDLAVMLQLSEIQPGLQTYLDKPTAEDISRKMTATLQQLYPQLSEAGIVFVGAGYQISQIMRPKFPIYHELTEVSKITFRPNNFEPSIVTITAKNGEFSVGAFNKDTQSPDPLYVFPTLLVLPKTEDNQKLVNEIENSIAQKAIVTEVLRGIIEDKLSCTVAHIHIVTLSDITSFFATQLIQINLEPLWEVIKHIVFEMGPTFQVLGSGHLVLWNGEEVVFIIPNQAMFFEIFGGDEKDYTNYRQTLKRLKLLLTDHGIQFSEFVAIDSQFFKEVQTVESALKYINN